MLQDKTRMSLVIEEHEIAALPITVDPDILGERQFSVVHGYL